ncbi:MAG: Stf0 family sulfotransferase [Planctomycetota bacterium]|jgi:LPS sulfotransferase NodH
MKFFDIGEQKVNYQFENEPKPSHLRLFERLAKQPDNTEPIEKSFVAFCTPRCGSTLFAEALNSSGRLGICEEWFNYDYFNAWACMLGREFDLRDYLDWVFRKSVRDTGVFMLKMHVGQLTAMSQDFGLGLGAMEFDHVIYLYRRDKIAQAVSLCKAASSGKFRSYEKAASKEKLDRSGIGAALNSVIQSDDFARRYLLEHFDAVYAYEDFRRLGDQATRPHHSYEDVLSRLGKKGNFTYSAGKLKRQADMTSESAANDFHRYILGEIE